MVATHLSYDEKIHLARSAEPGMRWVCRKTGKVTVVVSQGDRGMINLINEATGRKSSKQHHFLAAACYPVMEE